MMKLSHIVYTIGSTAALVVADAEAEVNLSCAAGERLVACISRALGYTKTSSSSTPVQFDINLLLKEVEDQVTGTSTGGAVTSKEDFLPNLIVNLPDVVDGLALTGPDATDKTLDFTYNIPICPGNSATQCVQVSASLARDPMVSDAILDTIPEPDRASVRATLSDGLNSFDDYSIRVAYTFNGKIGGMRFGREVGQYMPAVRAVHGLAFRSSVPRRVPVASFPNYLATRHGGYSLFQDSPGNVAALKFQTLTAEQQRHINSVFAEFLNQHAPHSDSQAEDAVLRRFVEEIDNQPQFIVAAHLRERDDRVGADERGVSVRLEIPLERSFNGMVRNLKDLGCLESSTELTYAETVGCLGSIDNALEDDGKQSWRAALEYQYSDIGANSVELENTAASFFSDGVESQILSASISRKFNGIGDVGQSELTFELSYQDVSNDPTRNDRTRATVSWAFRYQDLSFPVSLIYSNRPEFDLMDVDSQLTATVGIKYDIEALNRSD